MSAVAERSLSLYEHLDLLDLAAQSEESPEGATDLELQIRREIASATAEKIENIHRLFVSIDMTDGAIDAEMKRLREHREANDRIRKRVRESVKHAMICHQITKISGKTVTFSLRRTPPAVVISDEEQIPARFKSATATMPADLWAEIFQFLSANDARLSLRLIDAVRAKAPTFSVVKASVKKELDAGEDVPGADMSIDGQSLVVK